MNTFGDYHDLYMKTDVLLADIFERFRATCLSYYGLDPAHYYTAPGLSLDAMLKMTGVSLELFTDPDMHLFVENGIRGGVSMISHKFSHANNPYTPDYHPEQPSKYILYLDCNNLYGGAMSKKLPISHFWWLNENEIYNLDVDTIPPESEIGYILEVDMEYPTSLHDSDSDYPLAPANVCIDSTMLSSYTKRLGEKVKVADSKVNKLTPNLHDKTNYVIHYHNLQQYLRLGMKLTKIHRVLGFTQSAWLKPYISYNTEKRKAATNSFEKDFFKLLNNAIFGNETGRVRLAVVLWCSVRRLMVTGCAVGKCVHS